MKKTFLLLLALLLTFSLIACGQVGTPGQSDETTDPVSTSDYKGPEFFVATDGDDANDGSAEHPFASINAAADRIRALRADGNTDAFTVTVREGTYEGKPYVFQATDGGISLDAPVIYRAEGDVTILGGKQFMVSDFAPVTDEAMKARFAPEVADGVLVYDLAAAGITKDMIGGVYAYGSANQAGSHGDEYKGTNISVFCGDTRLMLARYPNDSGNYVPEDFLWIDTEEQIIDEGSKDAENPYGGTLKLSDEANAHMSRWATLDGAWSFGYYMFDWADETTPVKDYNKETGEVTFLFRPYSGYRVGGSYYFYNVAEELDVPGEYWIDRDNLKLYLIPTEEENAVITINLEKNYLFSGEIANPVFDGFTSRGFCSTIFSFSRANGWTLENSSVLCCDGYGFISSKGDNNTVRSCSFIHMGQGGGYFNGGGDAATLTHSNNLIENNYLLHYSEIQRMYGGCFGLNGVGGSILHNEIGYAPHSALGAGGQENLIAWNYVHDVVQECNDGGAYYGGGQLHSIGNVIEHNKFENIGNETHGGTAVYFDDGLCGWTARYNIVIHASAGFTIGGGRNIEIYNNLIVNGGEGGGIGCDQRAYTWFTDGSHPALEHGDENNAWWKQLTDLPYNTGVWAERYPNLAKIHYDIENTDDIDFACNPSYDVIRDNIFIGEKRKWTYWFEDRFYTYSTIENNLVYESLDRIFEPGTYDFNKVGKRAKINWETFPYDGYGVVAD